jgi:diguanylate cyclase (GGDEF)-like protein
MRARAWVANAPLAMSRPGTVTRARRAVAGIESLLERWRPYDARRFDPRERAVEATAAVLLVAVAVALPTLVAPERPLDIPLGIGLAVLFAVASRVRLYLGAGYAMSTQLVLVPMLFLLPPATVPAWVACGFLLAGVAADLRRGAHPERLLTSLADSWHAVGPALVFVVAGEPEPRLAALPLLALALVAQCGTDLLSATAREWAGRGISPAVQSLVVLSVYLIDACLTPVGLLVAIAGAQNDLGVLVVAPLLALLAALAADRRRRMQEAGERLDELSAQRERIDRAIRRIGEAFASTLDRAAIVDLITQTAAEALAARPGSKGPQRLGTDVLAISRDEPFTAEETALFGYLSQQAAIAVENVDLHDRLRRQATVDELTGLSNHRRFHDVLAEEVTRSRRSGSPVALVLLDIDDFKAVNDTFGHRHGDEVLRAVAGAVAEACRATDEAARYGGEELAIVLRETDLDGALTVGEAVRRAVAQVEVPVRGGPPTRVTVSVGVSALGAATDDHGALVEAADKALYDSKRAGKDRVTSGGWTAPV